VNRGDAGELPIQTDAAKEGGAGDLIVIDIVQLQPAGIVPVKKGDTTWLSRASTRKLHTWRSRRTGWSANRRLRGYSGAGNHAAEMPDTRAS
jgi:hypothetical protein